MCGKLLRRLSALSRGPMDGALGAGSVVSYATLAVNVVGCFLIGVLAAMANVGGISPMAKLLLVMGFCGAFTTFSTFMNDNLLMARDGQMLAALLYTVLSMVLGMVAVVAGYQVVK